MAATTQVPAIAIMRINKNRTERLRREKNRVINNISEIKIVLQFLLLTFLKFSADFFTLFGLRKLSLVWKAGNLIKLSQGILSYFDQVLVK